MLFGPHVAMLVAAGGDADAGHRVRARVAPPDAHRHRHRHRGDAERRRWRIGWVSTRARRVRVAVAGGADHRGGPRLSPRAGRRWRTSSCRSSRGGPSIVRGRARALAGIPVYLLGAVVAAARRRGDRSPDVEHRAGDRRRAVPRRIASMPTTCTGSRIGPSPARGDRPSRTGHGRCSMATGASRCGTTRSSACCIVPATGRSASSSPTPCRPLARTELPHAVKRDPRGSEGPDPEAPESGRRARMRASWR